MEATRKEFSLDAPPVVLPGQMDLLDMPDPVVLPAVEDQAGIEGADMVLRFGELPLEPFTHIDRKTGEIRTHVSPSMLTMAARCLEQYRRRYRLGHKDPPSGSMLHGLADHEAISWGMRQWFAEHRHEEGDTVAEVFATAFEQRVHEAGEVEWNDLTFAESKDVGVRLVRAYMQDVAPAMEPETVEEEIRNVVIPGMAVPLTGYVDMKAKVNKQGVAQRRIIERKVTGRNQLSGAHRFQAEIYQLHEPLVADVQLSLRQKKDPRVVHETHLVEPSAARTLYKVRSVILAIANAWLTHGDDEPWPDAITSGFACQWCGWGPAGNVSCPYWSNTYRWEAPGG